MHAEGNVNVFVAKAIWFSLMQFRPLSFSQIHLVILFDQGFLSGTTNSSSKFINYQTQCSKNGLGSSACVVVSIVKAICQLHQQKNELFIECLSHAANLAAQNKIGSNFDISSAIHGSHLYTNVLPRRAYSCIETGRIDNIVGLEQKNYVLSNTNKWVQNSCSLLVDMRKGSNTRIMVSGFLNQLQRMP